MSEQKWPKEPYHIDRKRGCTVMGDGRRLGMCTEDEIRAAEDRSIVCLNACANIADPAAALTAAREALEAVDAWGNGIRHHTAHESRMVKAARAALALLGGE